METPDVSEGKERDRGTAGSGQALGERLRLKGPRSILCRQPGDGSASPKFPDLDLAMGFLRATSTAVSSAQCTAESAALGWQKEACTLLNQSVQPHWAPHHPVKQKALPYNHTHRALPPQKKKQTMASKDSILNLGLTGVPKSRS